MTRRREVGAAFLAIAILVAIPACQGSAPASHSRPASAPRSQTTPTPATLTLDSIAMFGDDGWAVTADSAGPISNVLRTADGGSTWRKVTPQIAQDGFIFGFTPIDVSHAWLMAAGQSQGSGPVDLWSTNDGGQAWSKTTAPALVFRGALIMFSDGVHGWLATPGEPISQFQQQGIVIDRTTDGGKTWKLVSQTNFAPDRSTAGAPSVNCGKSDVSFLNASTGWLTGGCTGGITFDMTSDGGVTWKAQKLTPPRGGTFVKDCEGGPCALSGPRFVSAGYGYTVLHDTGLYPGRSWLYISRDGGRTWNAHALPGQETKVAMLTASIGFANVGEVVDSAGAVDAAAPWLYRTADGGTSWQPVPANLQLPFAALDCVSASRCWALGQSLTSPNSSTLYETTDGGRTWSVLAVRIL